MTNILLYKDLTWCYNLNFKWLQISIPKVSEFILTKDKFKFEYFPCLRINRNQEIIQTLNLALRKIKQYHTFYN